MKLKETKTVRLKRQKYCLDLKVETGSKDTRKGNLAGKRKRARYYAFERMVFLGKRKNWPVFVRCSCLN